MPGFHEVSYIPPNIQHEKIKDNLSEGIKRIYVAINDTLEVFLFYDHYLSQIDELETEFRLQNIVGASLVGVLIRNLFYILIFVTFRKIIVISNYERSSYIRKWFKVQT